MILFAFECAFSLSHGGLFKSIPMDLTLTCKLSFSTWGLLKLIDLKIIGFDTKLIQFWMILGCPPPGHELWLSHFYDKEADYLANQNSAYQDLRSASGGPTWKHRSCCLTMSHLQSHLQSHLHSINWTLNLFIILTFIVVPCFPKILILTTVLKCTQD